MALILVKRLDEAGQLQANPARVAWIGETMPVLDTLWALQLTQVLH